MRYMLVINPGSTSTKVAVYDGRKEILNQTIRYDSRELSKFEKITDQYELRIKTIEKVLGEKKISLEDFDIVVGRGGLLKPLDGGAWIINEAMLDDLRKAERGEHASNLGAVIAHNIAKKIGVKSYIVDPVVVDELEDVARISGIPEIERTSVFHALNHKASARQVAGQIGKKYEELNLIVAHMGGGITIGAHKGGRVIDVTNGFYGEGPLTPGRSGSLPSEQIIKMCFSGKYTEPEMLKKLHGKGGMLAYLGTADCIKAEKEAQKGNKKFTLILDAMAYQIAKEIGAMATVLDGKVDAVILTGGLAFSKRHVEKIIERVKFISKVYVIPGENEMEALRDGVLMALAGEMPLREYT